MKYKDKRKCHARHNFITKHYSAIVGEDKDNYEYKGLSHEKYQNKRIRLKHNPDKNDKKDAWIEKRSRIAKKINLIKRNHGNSINLIAVNYKH